MRKRIAVICMLALLLSLFALINPEAKAATGSYRVGYARVDINPYFEENDFSSGIMALPLRGGSDVWNRLSKNQLLDDNGDGVTDEQDGLKATCIAVTDEEGKTILMITVDLIGGTMVDQVRPTVVERVNAAIASGEVTGVQELTEGDIFYAGTHTHSGPDSTVYAAAGITGTNNDGVDLSVINEDLGIWIDRTVEDICDAAIASLQDRAEATLTKDQLSASNATSAVIQDKTMNSTRHYFTEVDGEEFACGDNFNAVTKASYADPSDYKTSRGADPRQVTQADDTIYLLQFSFEDAAKLPIILTEWRGHPSLNNTNDYANSSKNAISSDYVNAYRHALEYGCDIEFDTVNGSITNWTLGTEQKYRVAFFNGSGGNVNPRGYEVVTYNGSDGAVSQYANQWIEDSGNCVNKSRATAYGVVLAQLAKECLDDGLNETSVTAGKINTSQLTFYTARKTTGITELSYKAATAYRAAAEVGTVYHPYTYTDPDTGEIFLIGSKFHASNIVGSWNTVLGAPITTTRKIELSTIMLGKDVAFVVVPGEAFDFYYKDTTLTGDAKYADANNLWKDLIDESTYGRPYILGYTNGAQGYFPNYEAYVYTPNSTKWVKGSYETHNTKYEQGTGENIVRIFHQMLKKVSTYGGMTYTGPCAHCGENQTWEPYNAQTALTTGHYYLYSDVSTAQIKVAGGQTVCIDLQGYTLSGDTRALYTSDTTLDTVNIMDFSEAQTGTIRGCGGTYGAAAGFGGGTIVIAEGDVLNLYSGTLTSFDRIGYSVCAGGILRIRGTFNMYGGTVTGGIVSSFSGSYLSSGIKEATREGNGGCISLTGTMNIYGGQITNGAITHLTGTATTDENGKNHYQETEEASQGKGSCIWVEETGVVNLRGSAKIDQIHFADEDGLSVVGSYIGSAELKYATIPEPVAGTVLGSCLADETGAAADVSSAAITLADAEGMTAAVKGSELAVSDLPYTYEVCQACGDCQWVPTTDADFDAMSAKNMKPGHYRLTEDVATVQKQLNSDGSTPGTYCVDLAGHTFTGASRAFLVYQNATLNIFDSVGTGLVEGKASAATGGAVLYSSKAEINLYGGTVKHNTANSEVTLNGGAVRVNGGSFTMYGGTIVGGDVTDYGGAVYVTKYGSIPGSFTVKGGEVTMGTAEIAGGCVYVGDGGSVIVSGDGDISEICYNTISADTLTVEGSYTGTLALKYEDASPLEDLTDVGNGCADENGNNADVSCATISFTDAEGITAAVKDGDLVVSDVPYTYGTCEVCGDCRWKPMTEADFDALGKANMTPGHYILIEDVTTPQKTLNSTGENPGVYCVDLNGHTFTGEMRAFYAYAEATLNIFDYEGGGVVSGLSGANIGGGVLYADRGEIHLYGGTVRHDPTNSETIQNGGGVRVNGGTFHLHDGVIEGCGVDTYGGAIFVSNVSGTMGNLIVSGGKVVAGSAGTAGNCVYISSGATVTLQGDAVLDEVRFGTSSANTLTIDGNFTGSVALAYPNTVTFTELTDIGNCTSNADVSYATITFPAAEGMTAAVRGSDLVVSHAPYTYGTCEVCGECQWRPMTEADFDAMGNYNITPGHYVLTEDVITTQKKLNNSGKYPGTYCLDLAGHTYTGESRAIIAAAETTLNIFDSVGGGVITGRSGAAIGGGVLYALEGTVNLYNGTVRHDPTNADTIQNAGAVRVNGGTFRIHGGIVEGCGVDTYGGAVYVSNLNDGPGYFIASGGKILAGNAAIAGDCVYIGIGSSATLQGDAVVDEICFEESSADSLIINGSYTGRVALKYPDTLSFPNGLDLGNCSSDAAISGITFTDVPCKALAISGTDLVVTDSAIAHSYEAAVTAPTCTGEGFTTYTCICGDSYIADKIAATGHSYEAVTTRPTCTEAGYTAYSCSVCGYSYVGDEVAATGHSYDAVVTAPTCTEAGFTTYTCHCGDSYVADQVAATGHSYKAAITAPTCTEAGFTTYTCTVCDDSYVADETAPTGHSYKTVTVEPTCTENGSITDTCSICSDVQTETIPATGHSYKAVVTAPTCTDAGYTTYTCASCADSYQDDEVAATGHSYETVTIQPTCSSEGSITNTCLSCSDVIVEVIPATGHSYEAVVTAPTCTDAGYTTYTCATCSHSYTADETAPLGHDYMEGTQTCTVCGIGYCVHCGADQIWQPFGGETQLTTGHYYLASDIQSKQVKVCGGQSICFDLMGHTFTAENRCLYTEDSYKDVISIMDSSEAQTGTLQGCGAYGGAGTGYGGGTIVISPKDELNLYSGTLTAWEKTNYSVSAGGVLRIRGVFNMYGGTVIGGTASSFSGSYFSAGVATTGEKTGNGGCISLAGTLNFYGGQITGGSLTAITSTITDGVYSQEVQQIDAVGTCLWVDTTGKVNLYNDASVEQIYFVDGDGLTVAGNYTGTVELQYGGIEALTDLTDVGDSLDADVSNATITFTDAPGKTAAVRGTDLVISDAPYPYGICEACGECQWLPLTDAQLDAWDKFDMTPGHYRLTEDVTTVQKQLNGDGTKPGTYCLDLAGHTFAGGSRAFLVYTDAVLNIQDSVGGAMVTGQVTSAAGGGVLYLSGGTIHLYGGTVEHIPNLTDVVGAGGAVRIYSGSFYLHGGTLIGCDVANYGGAVYVARKGDVPGIFVASGGKITMGTAQNAGDCVYVGDGCSVILTGDPEIPQISFHAISADTLTIEDTFTGTVALKYPDTVSISNGTDVGNCSENADISGATITFSDVVCKAVSVDGTNLVVVNGETGHNYTGIATAPTCTEVGYTTYSCTVCGDVYTTDKVAATGHSFVNGSCTLCGEADPDYVKPSVKPTLGLKYPSLSFEDVIIMNVYYSVANTQDVVEMGLITYTEKPETYGVETADAVIPGYGVEGGLCFSSTEGIAPKDIGDTIYFAVYAKLTDGTYVYTSLIGYSPKTYATNMLKTGTTEMKTLVAAMLNYGAAAQNYFSYKVDTLVNADMTDEQKSLVAAYSADMIAAVTQPGTKAGALVSNGGHSKFYPTISFEGAFCINYYFQPKYTVSGDVTMYIWTLEDYEAAEVLSKDNATKAIPMTLTETGEYLGVVDGIAAKDLDKAVYVSVCYSDGNTDYCSGTIGYTIGLYCKGQAAKTGTLADLAAACAVYGYYAKQLFG